MATLPLMRALLRSVTVSGEPKVRAMRGTDREWPKGISSRSPFVAAAAAATTDASKGLHAPFSAK
jgi:anthranilate/para-aminobenzoate synthase component I